MRHIAIVLCLIAGLLAQGFALAGQVSALGIEGGPAHAALHLDSVAHHHEHDGSIHKDGSTESQQHLQSHCCVSFAGIPPSTPEVARPFSIADVAVSAVIRGHGSPFLEGLKRPPR